LAAHDALPIYGEADLLGMGISAISQIGALYAQNHRQIDTWQSAVQHGEMPVAQGYVLDRDDLIRRDMIMSLLCHLEVDLAAFDQRWGIQTAQYFTAELAALAAFERDGLVRREGARLHLTETGRLAARAVAMCFDRYHSPADTVRFSRII